MSMILITGIGAVAALILYFAFKLEEQHFVLQLLAIFFAFILLTFVPAATVNASEVCEFVNNGTATYYKFGNNLTDYHWDYDDADAPNFNNPNDPASVFVFHEYTTLTYEEQCYENTSTIPTSFMFTYYGFLTMFFMYVSVMIVWTVYERLTKRMKGE